MFSRSLRFAIWIDDTDIKLLYTLFYNIVVCCIKTNFKPIDNFCAVFIHFFAVT